MLIKKIMLYSYRVFFFNYRDDDIIRLFIIFKFSNRKLVVIFFINLFSVGFFFIDV